MKKAENALSVIVAICPLVFLAVCIIILRLAPPMSRLNTTVIDVPLLFTISNIIFLVATSYVVAYLAFRGYLLTGAFTLLHLGLGILTLGTSALIAGALWNKIGPNAVVTVLNTCTLLASIYLMAGTITHALNRPPLLSTTARRRRLLFGVVFTLAFAILLAIAANRGLTPVFFIDGVGSTAIRQSILIVSLLLFIVSASSMMTRFLETRIRFFFWYSIGIWSFTIGLAALLVMNTANGLMNWTGRMAQYVAGLYFLAAAVSASRLPRERGTLLSHTLSDLFQRKVSSIFESMTDCHYELDRKLVFIQINDRALEFFGKRREDLIGRSILEVFNIQKDDLIPQFTKVLDEHVQIDYEMESRLMPGKWIEIHSYPAEDGISVYFRDISARKKTEAAVLEEKEKLSALINSIQDEIWFADATGQVTFVNSAAAKEFCLDNAKLSSVVELAKLFEVYGPDGTPRLPRESPPFRSLEGEIITNEEEIVRTPASGMLRHRQVSSSPVRDVNNNIIGSVSVVRDITEQKKAEREMFQLASVVEHSSDFIALAAVDGPLFYMNEAGLRMTGLRPDELKKETDEMHALPEPFGARLKDQIIPAVKERGRWEGESQFRNVITGKVTDVYTTAFMIYDPHTRAPLYIANISQDITERKRAEQAVKQQSQLQQRILDELPVGVNIVEGNDLRIRYVNPAYQAFAPGKKFTGKTMTEVLPEGQPHLDNIFRKVLQDGETYSEIDQSHTIFRGPGLPAETAYFTWSVSRILMPDGNWGLLITALETTARKQMEEELRQAKDQMELRVAERTVELQQAYEKLAHEVKEREQTEEQLRQSQKMEAIGTLAGGIAHDFNNILAGILGFTEMAIEDAQGQPQIEKTLTNVVKSARRGRDLVKQILAFSRKADYERSPFAITPIITETIRLLRASIPATVEIKFSSTAQSDVVYTSPTEIQQIIMNLSTNAFIAMEGKGGTLEIDLSDAFQGSDRSSGEYVQIIVKDTGVGMTPEVMQKAFDPFFTTREPGKGSGMGLAVVYGIVRNLNGSITVLSTPGEGSTFRVFLPKITAPANTEQESAIDIERGNETILFVEDEEMLNDWGKSVLEKLGYTVHAFRDPEEALQTFIKDSRKFDIVISDQAMPKMTGSQLIAQIRALRDDIPIMLCTGYAQPIPPEKVIELGIAEVLLKPLTKHEFAAAIRRVLVKGKPVP